MGVDFNLVKSLVACGVLLLASYQDLKTREVDDRLWYALAGCNGVLTALQFTFENSPDLLVFAASVVAGLGVALAVHFAGLMGGADVKAIVALSLTETPPVSSGIFSLMPSIAIVTNAILISLAGPLAMLVRNLRRGRNLFKDLCPDEPRWKAALAVLTLTKVSREEYGRNSYKYRLAEVVEGDCKRLLISISVEEGGKTEVAGGGEVWVSYFLPYIVFITAGYIAYKVLGAFLDYFLPFNGLFGEVGVEVEVPGS